MARVLVKTIKPPVAKNFVVAAAVLTAQAPSGAGPHALTGQSVSITTTGNRVRIGLMPEAVVGGQNTKCNFIRSGNNFAQANIRLFRDGVEINQINCLNQPKGSADATLSPSFDMPPTAFTFYDNPPAGTYVYDLRVGSDGGWGIFRVRMFAEELTG